MKRKTWIEMFLVSVSWGVLSVSHASPKNSERPFRNVSATDAIRSRQSQELNTWITNLDDQLLERKMQIGFQKEYGRFTGIITASPDADYQFMWRRDSALVMQAYLNLVGPDRARPYFQKWAERTREMQVNWNPSAEFTFKDATDPDLEARNRLYDRRNGEPKFNPNGSAYLDGWLRPQDDGPALFVITMSNWLQHLLKTGQVDLARKYYDGTANSVVKSDLEYISHVWSQISGDPWEEVRGHHVYNLKVMHRALLKGAVLARQLQDLKASAFYLRQAKQIQKFMQEQMYVMGANSQTAIQVTWAKDQLGMDHKSSVLDAQSAILVQLHGNISDDQELKLLTAEELKQVPEFMPINDPRVLNTFYLFEKEQFEYFYINRATANLNLPPALGRYIYDRYREGNPWVLTTLAGGTFHAKLYCKNDQLGEIQIDQTNLDFYRSRSVDLSFLKAGDRYKRHQTEFKLIQKALLAKSVGYGLRVKFHSPRIDVHDAAWGLHEQINGMNGTMMSDSDLTWNYAELITYKQNLQKAQAVAQKVQ